MRRHDPLHRALRYPGHLVLRLLVLVLGLWPALASAAEDAMPAPAGAPEPPADALVDEIPFEPGHPTRVMIDLAPEGKPSFRMMLDTGAAQSVMTPLMARELGVSVRALKDTPYRRKTRLGRDLQFRVDTRTSDTGSKTGWEYGLLGGDFLNDYVLELDYPRERVRFFDPKRYEVPKAVGAPDEKVVRFKREGTRVLAEIEIDGRARHVLLDTGAPTTVLSGRVARKLGIDVDALPEFGELGTVMGPMPVRFFETDSFRFVGFPFDRMPVLVAPKGWYNMSSSDSVVGYDVLRHFTIRIDYKRKRLWLRRASDPLAPAGAEPASVE